MDNKERDSVSRAISKENDCAIEFSKRRKRRGTLNKKKPLRHEKNTEKSTSVSNKHGLGTTLSAIRKNSNTELETKYHPETRSASTAEAINFVYLDEDSNKENIAPETYEIFEADKSKKAKRSDNKSPPIIKNSNANTSDPQNFEVIKKYLKKSTTLKEKDIAAIGTTQTPSNNKRPLKTKNENTKKMKSKFL